MSQSRWKVMACSLGLSIGGLAIVAGPMNNRLNAQFPVRNIERVSPAPTAPPPVDMPADKPLIVSEALETLPPVQSLEFTVPAVTTPMVVVPVVGVEVVPQVVETLPAPRQTSEPFDISTETVVTSPMPAAPIAPLAQVYPATQPPRSVEVAPVAPTPDFEPAQEFPANPPVQFQTTPVPPSLPPAPPPVVVQQNSFAYGVTQQTTARLKMLMRLGDGRPRFEIRNSESTELLLKVYGEKVEMQQSPEGMQVSPIAGVTATGQVRFVGPGVEGTCDQLSVLSGTGEVLMKGNVTMRTGKNKSSSEVKAEKMIYQINANGLTTVNSGAIRPASFSPTVR